MMSSVSTSTRKKVLVVVAHPDDEMLWCGGTMLRHSDWSWRVITLCRGDDPDRRRRFFQVMDRLGAVGRMGTLDDGPEQHPLQEADVAETIISMLDETQYDLVLTHGPFGEYTRHRRHEEVCAAVISLWERRILKTDALWLFAYDDGNRSHYPIAIDTADGLYDLPTHILHQKQEIISDIYGFSMDSWEYKTTPTKEGFRCFNSPADIARWIIKNTPLG